MNGKPSATVLRAVRSSAADARDADLLAWFASDRHGPAFAELVRRHGPVVLGVCRRVTGHAEDAEDAFQAVFLILAQKAEVVRRPELLGNYLYGVAVRVARRAKRSAARRRKREVQVAVASNSPASITGSWSDLAQVLDEELTALPEWHRTAVLLCDVQGLPRTEAAVRLGVPEGTLSSRLNAGRKKLAARLTRRGVVLTVAGLPAVVTEISAAAVPDALVRVVVGTAESGEVSGLVAGLTRERGWPMRTKLAGVGTLGAITAVGWATFAGPVDQPKPPDPPLRAPEKPSPLEKPAEKAEVFTAGPRLLKAVDLRISGIRTVEWSPDGKALAVLHTKKRQQKLGPDLEVSLISADAPSESQTVETFPVGSSLIGFVPGTRVLVTELHESQFISGRHEMTFWSEHEIRNEGGKGMGLPGMGAPSIGGRASNRTWVGRTIPLDADRLTYARFAPDGKSFRALSVGSNAGEPGDWLQAREVDAATGQTKRTFPRIDVKWKVYDFSPDGRQVAVANRDHMIELWDVETGKRGWASKPGGRPPRGPLGEEPYYQLIFSSDGRRIGVTGNTVALVLDAANGARLLAEDEVDEKKFQVLSSSFSGNGRFLAWVGRWWPVDPQALNRGLIQPQFRIWDVEGKKLLKSWSNQTNIFSFAFAPQRPLLAIFEEQQGAQETRLGFWDLDVPAVGQK
jgi:RNA polymerase sigma factor (sigma-70 family)